MRGKNYRLIVFFYGFSLNHRASRCRNVEVYFTMSFHNYLYGGFGYGDGYLLENMTYLDLRRKGYTVYVGNIVGKEVDFVAIKGDSRIYVQSCLTLSSPETAEREYAPLLKIGDNFPKYIVSLDDYRIPSIKGIEQVKPWERM